jgi:hypothetical protein
MRRQVGNANGISALAPWQRTPEAPQRHPLRGSPGAGQAPQIRGGEDHQGQRGRKVLGRSGWGMLGLGGQ